MLGHIHIQDILFLDIETVPAYSIFEDSPEEYRDLWEKKSAYFRKEGEQAKDVYGRAGIYAEFGKIICISAGHIFRQNDGRVFRVKSFYGDEEKTLLEEFARMLSGYTSRRNIYLCAHNGKEFDFPYIARRMLINRVPLPDILDMAGKKPWEVPFLDTLELWKFGDYKHYTSLALLAHVFGISSPKEDLDGSMIAGKYWEEHDMERIVAYCERDAFTVAQIFLRYRGESFLPDDAIDPVR